MLLLSFVTYQVIKNIQYALAILNLQTKFHEDKISLDYLMYLWQSWMWIWSGTAGVPTLITKALTLTVFIFAIRGTEFHLCVSNMHWCYFTSLFGLLCCLYKWMQLGSWPVLKTTVMLCCIVASLALECKTLLQLYTIITLLCVYHLDNVCRQLNGWNRNIGVYHQKLFCLWFFFFYIYYHNTVLWLEHIFIISSHADLTKFTARTKWVLTLIYFVMAPKGIYS